MNAEQRAYIKQFADLRHYPDQLTYLAACGISPKDLKMIYPTAETYTHDTFTEPVNSLRFKKDIPLSPLHQTGTLTFSRPQKEDQPFLTATRALVNHHTRGVYPEREVRMRIYPNYGAHLILTDRGERGINNVSLALNYLGNIAPTWKAYENGSMYTRPRHRDHSSDYPLFPWDDSTAATIYTTELMQWTRRYLDEEWGLSFLLPPDGKTQGLYSPQKLFNVLVTTPPLQPGEGRNPVDFRFMMEKAGLITSSAV